MAANSFKEAQKRGIKRHSVTLLQLWSFLPWRSKIKICYTFLMSSPREDWIRWAETLRRYQADGFVSWLLEGGRPLAVLTAQVLYWGQPFLGDTAWSVGQMLESDEEARAFTEVLNGGAHS